MKDKDERTTLRRSALLAVLPLSAASLLFFPVRKTEANAGAMTYFEGTNASSIAVIGETQVELQSACFTFSVPSYGTVGYDETSPKAVAVYTLYNPTASEQTLTLAYPYELVQYGLDRENWNEESNCSFRTGNAELAYTLHYTYRKNDGFDVMASLNRLEGKDEFYTPDLPVTKYTYRIDLEEGESNAYIRLYLKGATQSKILGGEDCISMSVENGYRCLGYRVSKEACEVSYYALGGENEVACVGCARKERAAAEKTLGYTLVEKSETTFAQYVQANQPESLLQEDWIRIAADYFNDHEYNGILSSFAYCAQSPLVRWYVYSLTVPAGGMVEHTVSAPFYPASSPYANRFCFQLAPLSLFPACGEISVSVQTPFYMQYSTMEFEKSKNDYSFSRDTLPYGELSFSLTRDFEPQPYVPDNDRHDPLTLALCILAALVAGTVIIVVVLTVRTKRQNKESERLRRRAEMTRPEEGKIDDGTKHGRA